MSLRSRSVVALAVVGLAALGGVAYYAQRSGVGSQPTGGGAAPAPGMTKAIPGAPAGAPAVSVEVRKVNVGTMTDSVAAVGTLRSNESVVLRPEIAGRIKSIDFSDGARVAKGTRLVALDAAIQEAELRQAQASLALSRANFKRTEDLFRKKFVSERAKDEAAANLKVQEAALALAQARFERTRLRAPFAGIVGIRSVSPGDYVKEGADLINLEDIATLKVDFRLPETLLGRIHKGQSVELASEAFPGRSFRATVDAIDPLVDSNGRAVLLRARLPNPEDRLRPGMFVRVNLILGSRAGALTVPEEALVPAGEEQFLFRIRDGKAQRLRIRTGQRRGSEVEVLEGLKEGDLVVTAGQLKIRDRAAVKLVEAGAAQQAAVPGEAEKR